MRLAASPELRRPRGQPRVPFPAGVRNRPRLSTGKTSCCIKQYFALSNTHPEFSLIFFNNRFPWPSPTISVSEVSLSIFHPNPLCNILPQWFRPVIPFSTGEFIRVAVNEPGGFAFPQRCPSAHQPMLQRRSSSSLQHARPEAVDMKDAGDIILTSRSPIFAYACSNLLIRNIKHTNMKRGADVQ